MVNELCVFGQWANERMGVQEVERLLPGQVPVDQLTDGAQAEGGVGMGDVTSAFDLRGAIAPGQAEQTLEYAHAFDAARLQHGLGPAAAARAEPANAP